jgi:hypothetical protein
VLIYRQSLTIYNKSVRRKEQKSKENIPVVSNDPEGMRRKRRTSKENIQAVSNDPERGINNCSLRLRPSRTTLLANHGSQREASTRSRARSGNGTYSDG